MTVNRTALPAALAKLGRTLRGLGSVADRDGDEWRKDMIALRRALASQLGELSNAATNDPVIGGDPATVTEFRTRMSAFRTALAELQANHPAVSVDRDDPSYRHRLQQATTSARDLLDWCTGAQHRHPAVSRDGTARNMKGPQCTI